MRCIDINWRVCLCAVYILSTHNASSQSTSGYVRTWRVDSGWAGNSINVTVFRKNAIVSWKGNEYLSFYDPQQFVVLAKRKPGENKWQIKRTAYKGNAADAHNTISLMVDGQGFLHLAWDHHNSSLKYCKSVAPGSLDLTEMMTMTGTLEDHVTYPEFYRLPNGNLLFMYRNGKSGEGNLVINQYDVLKRGWRQLQSNLIDGENQRNAYWQACVDRKGVIHISWVWRETPDVSSNHDLCYARSTDGGKTWTKSNGEKYQLPINATTAEYVCRIPQQTELINQTSMYADEEGNIFIASYWRENKDTIPQYHLVCNINNQWQTKNLGFRTTAFSLSGTGTKYIPISRPQVVSWKNRDTICTALIFRDQERGNKISLAINNNSHNNTWDIKDITNDSVGQWEPGYDTELWKEKKILHLFVQYADQKDNEGKSNLSPQPVQVLEWKPGR